MALVVIPSVVSPLSGKVLGAAIDVVYDGAKIVWPSMIASPTVPLTNTIFHYENSDGSIGLADVEAVLADVYTAFGVVAI